MPGTPLDPDAQMAMQPKQAKGGIFAINDIKLIKDALAFYARSCSGDETKQIVNLLHRLNNRT